MTEDLYDKLLDASQGRLTRQVLDNLSLPEADSQTEYLSYVMARLIPVTPGLVYGTTEEALSAISCHYTWHGADNVKAVVSGKTDSVVDLLQLLLSSRNYVNVNPFTLGTQIIGA